MGVTPQKIETALGSAFGGQQVSQIYAASDQYQVILELLPQYQRDASALSRLYVTASDGTTLVPLTSVVKVTQGTMPLSINHLGQLRRRNGPQGPERGERTAPLAPTMASSTKRKTTMAKRNRENAVRERRARKQARKDARKQAAADAASPPDDAPTRDAL